MFKFFLILLAFSSLNCLTLVSAETKIPTPTLLANVTSEMNTVDFWIHRHFSPDKKIMNSKDIELFNTNILNQHLTRNIFDNKIFLSNFSPKTTFENNLHNIISQNLFDADKPVKQDFFDSITLNINANKTFKPLYAIITQWTDERILPTDKGLFEKPNDTEFDQLQNSSLEIATPILILHRSLDHQWIYEINASSEGWIRADHVAISDEQTIQKFTESKNFSIVIAHKPNIFADPNHQTFLTTTRMGERFPLLKKNNNTVEIEIPVNGDRLGVIPESKILADFRLVRGGEQLTIPQKNVNEQREQLTLF